MRTSCFFAGRTLAARSPDRSFSSLADTPFSRRAAAAALCSRGALLLSAELARTSHFERARGEIEKPLIKKLKQRTAQRRLRDDC
jgi:hypothetical protein